MQKKDKIQGILRSMGTNSDQISGSALCLPCGLCCDGGLFGFARLEKDELVLANTLGMLLLNDKDILGFQQPCHLFVSGCCSIYDQRPKVCRRYECKLLRMYKAGKINQKEGLDKIDRAHQMLATLANLMPEKTDGAPTLQAILRQMSILSAASATERRQHQQFLLEAAKYQMFVHTHFRGMGPKQALPPAAPPEMKS